MGVTWEKIDDNPLGKSRKKRSRKGVKRRRATPRRSSSLKEPLYISWLHGEECEARGIRAWLVDWVLFVSQFGYVPYVWLIAFIKAPIHVCGGRIEADHVGARGLGQKCSDREAMALCSVAHRQRHDRKGIFDSRWMAAALRKLWQSVRSDASYAKYLSHGSRRR